MIIYKGIEECRLGDAPFIGALIIAAGCHHNCKNCFNQHLKELPNKFSTAADIIKTIKKNPFNQGIILGGLEWSEQPEELERLVQEALLEGLQVMIYTHCSEQEFLEKIPALRNRNVWCKFGSYKEELTIENYYSHGVKLATSNQYIKNLLYV